MPTTCPSVYLGTCDFLSVHECHAGRQPKGCDLMLSVQALKMLHSFVLSTDIESERHNSSERTFITTDCILHAPP